MIVLVAVYHLLTFTLPACDAAGCVAGSVPVGDQFYYIETQASHDSLLWMPQARWGAGHVAGGSSYQIACYPDTSGTLWYRVAVVDTSGNQSCWSNVVRVK